MKNEKKYCRITSTEINPKLESFAPRIYKYTFIELWRQFYSNPIVLNFLYFLYPMRDSVINIINLKKKNNNSSFIVYILICSMSSNIK
jgi:hypothetical protein